MEQYKDLDIVEVPLGSPHFHTQVERFLGANGLRMETMDSYYTVQDQDGRILAGAGISGDVIKCVAVSPELRSEGLLAPLISRIVAGRGNLKVFTKPEYQSLFESLGFKLLASAPLAILMENGRGLQQYCEYLKGTAHAAEENYFSGRFRKNQFPSASTAPPRVDSPGQSSLTPPVMPRTGVIVMNANPFTLGHKYLIDKALEQVDILYVIPVREDVSMFPYKERLEMIRLACDPSSAENNFSGRCPKNQFPASSSTLTIVLDGSDYSISAATFPTYFLKDLTEASETQMRLDLDLFCRYIAPALGATVRFAGSEPTDNLTAQYNRLMAEVLPMHGMAFVEVPRMTAPQSSSDWSISPSSGLPRGTQIISALNVRNALAQGDYRAAASMCPETTWPYLLAALAERALRMELDTPLKPGLVCPDSSGAHRDMDYGTMLRGIAAIRPFFPRMAMAGTPEELRQLGIDAEAAMLSATGGVNTHRGAIFALGLALNAVYQVDPREMQSIDTQQLIRNASGKIAGSILRNSLIDREFHFTPAATPVATPIATSAATPIATSAATPVGAKRMALEGYSQLFEDWLPFYRSMEISPLAPLGRNDKEVTVGLNDNRLGGNDKEVTVGPNDNKLGGNDSEVTVGGNDGDEAVGCKEGVCHFERSREISDFRVQRLLLRIMSTLDDTCIIKRAGKERAEQLKRELSGAIPRMTGETIPRMTGETIPTMTEGNPANVECLKDLCKRFNEEGISPGGAADMVALTIFFDSIH